MTHHFFLKAVAIGLLVPSSCLFAQDEETPLPEIRRPSIGVRFVYTPSRAFDTYYAQSSTTKPIADYTYSASTSKGGKALSPNVEYRLSQRFSLGLEFMFHRSRYSQITEMRTGTKDPNASTDTRPLTTITETTRASYWELPLVARCYGLGSSGLFKKAYLAGGLAYRHVGHIRTGTEYSNADGSTDYNEDPAKAGSTNQLGIVAGVGLRFIDDYRIKITPELRLTHWVGTTFKGSAFESAPNQFSVALGVSF